VISISALNWEWYRLKSEANALNTSLLATYKNLFPDERSMRDPLLQIQQKINLSKKLAGQSTEEDFLVMSGQFSQAWQLAHPQGTQLAGLEYKERSLFAKAKNSSEVQVESLRTALREYGLKLELKEGNYKISRDEGSSK
jgi:type II secretory pathway component PulL